MRLIGYAVRRSPFFRAGLYLPLGDLTVLLGANDTGKSTLLRALAADLAGAYIDEPGGQGCAFYVSVDESELAMLSNPRGLSSANRGIFDDWSHGGYDSARASHREVGEATMEAHLRVLREAATSDGFVEVLDALAESPIVCLEPPAALRFGWAAHWCLPPLAELDPHIVAALRRSDLHRFVRERADAAGEEFRRPGVFGARAARWIEVPAAPVVVAPLGRFPLDLPRPLAVPAEPEALTETVLEALRSTANVARWAPHDARGRELDERDVAERSGLKVLLEQGDDGSLAVNPVVVGAVRLLAVAAEERLPEFVSARYRLDVGLRPVTRWFEQPPVELALQPVTDSSRAARFALDDVADGLKLWLQLALLFGVDRLEQMLEVLRDGAAQDAQEVLFEGAANGEESAQDRFGCAVDGLASFGRGAGGEGDLVPQVAPAAAVATRHRPTIPGRVLLADEPEQHLNPRLQRRAARWLADLAAEGDSPCVVASHSNAFLSLAPGAQMVHVRRGPRGIELASFDPVAVEELDKVASDLGFDRGELLAGVSCLLLVEGEHEIAALRIYGRQLAEARVSLVAMHGSPPRGLLEVDALWRFTTAAVVVCLDNVRPEIIARAQADNDLALRKLRRSDSNEEKVVARLITQSQQFARLLHILGHPAIDLIDTFVPRAVQAVYPRYPSSHDIAQRAYADAVADATATDKPKPDRKAFLQDRYGVENSRRTYERIGAEHRRLGLRVPALEAIVKGATLAGEAADLKALGLSDDGT
jgi:predicted ATPase